MKNVLFPWCISIHIFWLERLKKIKENFFVWVNITEVGSSRVGIFNSTRSEFINPNLLQHIAMLEDRQTANQMNQVVLNLVKSDQMRLRIFESGTLLFLPQEQVNSVIQRCCHKPSLPISTSVRHIWHFYLWKILNGVLIVKDIFSLIFAIGWDNTFQSLLNFQWTVNLKLQFSKDIQFVALSRRW